MPGSLSPQRRKAANPGRASSRGVGVEAEQIRACCCAAIPVGDTARAECTPLHRGRTTMVWQTRVTRGDGKLAAVVTQTQLVMTGKR